jgi:Domain of unknown function (DUF1772)
MVALCFVIEIIVLFNSGIRFNIGATLFFFFVLEFVAYVLVLFAFAFILHGLLRVFRVPSNLVWTLPCFIYYVAVVIPIYALLSIPSDLVEYALIGKVGAGILLRPGELSRMTTDLLNQWGNAFKVAYYVCGIAVTLWSFVGVGFLSAVLSKFYWKKSHPKRPGTPDRKWFLWYLFAALLAYIIISPIETFVIKPISAKVQVIITQAQGSSDNRNAQN